MAGLVFHRLVPAAALAAQADLVRAAARPQAARAAMVALLAAAVVAAVLDALLVQPAAPGVSAGCLSLSSSGCD
jgi:hypothetical protein